ncbi:MAG: ATP-binding protein [Myxococcota bacterium]
MARPIPPNAFHQLVEALPVIAWVADADGRVTYFNARWSEFVGQPWDPSLGDAHRLAVHPDDLPASRERWRDALATGTPFDGEHRFRRHDGVYRWHLVRAVPLRADGEPTRWIGTCVDIDDRRRGNDAARFLADASAALAHVTDPRSTLERLAKLAVPRFADWAAIDVLDGEGRIERVALAHADPTLLQRVWDGCRRHPVQLDAPHGTGAVLRTGTPEIVPDVPEAALEAMAVDEQHLAWLRDAGPRSFLCAPLELGDGRVGAASFVFSTSGRRYRPSDLDTATDLCQRATVALQNARLVEALRAADREKTEFLAVLAHELRNPLAPLRTGIDLVARTPSSSPAAQAALQAMSRQVTHLTHLLDDLLDVDRIGRGVLRIRRQPTSLAEALDVAVETSAPHLAAGGHPLERIGPDVTVMGDATRLAQVFSNLLDNAARYSVPGGRVALTTEVVGDEVDVSVRDAGAGLSPDDLQRVFEPFVRLDPDGPGGLGIGLTLARRLIGLLGGTVTAHSDGRGHGSTFRVRLPLADTPAAPPRSAPPTPLPTRTLRVLVADDNRDAADLLAMWLTTSGHEVHVAYDGEQALALGQQLRPDVALLDLGMPKLDGRDVARRLRAEQPAGELLLVALTGWGQAEDRQATAAAGFDHHFTKPIDLAVLDALLAG